MVEDVVLDDTLLEFIQEMHHHLDTLEVALETLRTKPEDGEAIDEVLRLFHTLKGTLGFFDLEHTQRLAHDGESLLKGLKEHLYVDARAAMKLIFEALDLFREVLDALADKKGEEAFIEAFDVFQENVNGFVAIEEKRDSQVGKSSQSLPNTAGEVIPPQIMQGGWPVAQEFLDEVATLEEDLDKEVKVDVAPSATSKDVSSQKEVDNKTEETVYKESQEVSSGGSEESKKVVLEDMRIDEALLQSITELTTELVLTRNQLLKQQDAFPAGVGEKFSHLSTIISDLQTAVNKTRMVPIWSLWKKFPRLVRQLARQFHKEITLQFRNEHTEIETQILEALYDPLVHIVRNACDHGIELPDERWAKGKPKEGEILFEANYENGFLVLRLFNDGNPLDTEVIGRRAVQREIVSAEALESMTEKEIHALIFYPGFSTARRVSTVSGRGVGMDVVRTTLSALGGTVEILSSQKGMTVVLRVPTTLSIQMALAVRSGSQRFFLPHVTIEEVFSLNLSEDKNLRPIITRSEDSLFTYLGEEVLPTLSLGAILYPQQAQKFFRVALESKGFFIVLVYGNKRFGLLVDDVEETEEIGVGPIPSLFISLGVFSGTTLLSGGEVALILDVKGLAHSVGFSDVDFEVTTPSPPTVSETAEVDLLLIEHPDASLYALPLSLIDRLEQVSPKDFLQSEGQLVLPYQGGFLGVVPLKNDPRLLLEGHLDMILLGGETEQPMGLLVQRVQKVTKGILNLEGSGFGMGVLGLLNLEGKPVNLIDSGHYLHWYGHRPFVTLRQKDKRRPVVLVWESDTFRQNLFRTSLIPLGFDVIIEAGITPDAVLSDSQRENLVAAVMTLTEDMELATERKNAFVTHFELKTLPIAMVPATVSDLTRYTHLGYIAALEKEDMEGLALLLEQLCTTPVA